MNTITSLLEKIRNAVALDFGTIFSEAIELYKKTWVQGLILQLFTIIIMLPLIIILYIPLITMMIAQAQSGNSDPEIYSAFFAGMSIFYMLFVFVGVFVLGAVALALNAAFYRIIKKLDYDERIETSDFFYFLKGKYLSKTLMLVLISIVIAIPSALLCYIPLIYVMVPISFFTVVFAMNPDLSVGDIIKASFSLGNKKWLLTFGLLFVVGIIISIIGTITCGLGHLFLASFAYLPIYLIYKNVVGFEDDSEIIKIGISE